MTPLFLAAALSLAAAPTPQAHCYNLGSPGSAHYYPVNDHTVLVSAGLHAYRITTSPSELLDDRSAVLSTRFDNGTQVCSPLDLDLQVASPSGRSGLIVQKIEPLSRQEAEALRHGGPRRR